MFDPIALEGMNCEQVFTVELALFSTEPEISAGSIEQSAYVMVDWSVGFGIELSRQFNYKATPALVSSTGRIALEYLAKNNGAAYLPVDSEQANVSSLTLYRVPGIPTIPLSVHILYLPSNRNLPVIEAIKLQSQVPSGHYS